MRIDIYHHSPQWYEDKLSKLICDFRKEVRMNLDELIAKVTAENTVVDSVVTLLETIKTELDETIPLRFRLSVI